VKHSPDLVSAVAARERGRTRMRAATATVGLAGLVTAGVIAWNLPTPVHSTTTGASGTSSQSQATTPTTATTPATATRSRGEDDDGGHTSITSGGTTSAGTGSSSVSAGAHATSGGS
jgi:hypothetical protein